MSAKSMTGVVSSYNENFERGTIVGKDLTKYYVDKTCFVSGVYTLVNYEKVSFTVEKDEFGREYAGNVKPLDRIVYSKANKKNKYYGKIVSYTWLNEEGYIKLDDKTDVYFSKVNCIEYVNFNVKDNVNVSFSLKYNYEYECNEAYNIKMCQQDRIIGYIVYINKEKNFGKIKIEGSDKTSKDLSFTKKYCKEFDDLYVGDSVKFEYLFMKNNNRRVINVKNFEENNIFKRKVAGFIKGFSVNKEDNRISVFVGVNKKGLTCKDLGYDIRVTLDGIKTAFKRGDNVYVDVYKNKIRLFYYGKNIVKNTSVKTMSIYDKIEANKKKQNMKRNKNNMDINTAKMAISENNNNSGDIKEDDLNIPVKKSGVSLESIMESQNSKNKSHKVSNKTRKIKKSKRKVKKVSKNGKDKKKNAGEKSSKKVDHVTKVEVTINNTVKSNDKVDEITRKIKELERLRDQLMSESNKINVDSKSAVDNSSVNSEIMLNSDSVSDDVSSVNDSQYSH